MKRDERFRQLVDLAKGGDEAAIHDLWAEYGYVTDSGATEDGHDAD
ncbi:MAG: hypothetical protein K8T26_12410 [Lentisphaerae bacterium]|nr:hypothetical protein [Lentisphaerota bacterium]